MRRVALPLALTLAAVFALAVPQPARAQNDFTDRSFTLCGGLQVSCASFTTQVQQVGANDWRLIIHVRNTSGNTTDWTGPGTGVGVGSESSVITKFYIRTTSAMSGQDLLASNLASQGETATGLQDWQAWQLNKRNGGLGFKWTQELDNVDADKGACSGIVTAFNAPYLPCNGSMDPRTEGIFTLYFSERPVLENIAAQIYNIDAPSCYPSLQGPNAGQNDPFCESEWAVVPEPITTMLLATGLAGMGGAGLLRRRRRKGLEVVDD